MKKHLYEPPRFLDDELMLMAAELAGESQGGEMGDDPESPQEGGDVEDLP